MTYNGLPVFSVNLEDENIFDNISLVDFPAIETNFIRMTEEAEVKFSVNNEKRIVSGPILIPDQMIYRNNGKRQFYIKFSKEAIEQMALRFFKDHRNTEGNVMHQVEVDGVTFFESYLLNKERNIVPVEFQDLPEGTWFCSAKIENDEVWKMIKEGVLRGFSIDAVCTMTPADDKPLKTLDELMEYLNNNK